MGEFLFIFNDMSEPSLKSKVDSKVGQTSRNLRRTINEDEGKVVIKETGEVRKRVKKSFTGDGEDSQLGGCALKTGRQPSYSSPIPHHTPL